MVLLRKNRFAVVSLPREEEYRKRKDLLCVSLEKFNQSLGEYSASRESSERNKS